jgi:hypothetical protein
VFMTSCQVVPQSNMGPEASHNATTRQAEMKAAGRDAK